MRVDGQQFAARLATLQACIKYEEDDLSTARALLAHTPADDPDTMVNAACILYKEGKYSEAQAAFSEAMSAIGYTPTLAYNIALCQYAMKAYGAANKTIQGMSQCCTIV